MPDTRPGIKFIDGVCSACINHEKKQSIDWTLRRDQLRILCDKYRGRGHDCMIAVSGGKDSHWQVHVMKEEMGMNPLLVTVEDMFPMTEAGKHNIRNISERFGCDIISLKPSIEAIKKSMRYCFERYGKPTYLIDRYIYSYPLWMAKNFNIPLLVYGENVGNEYSSEEESPSAKDQINNGVASGITKDELIHYAGIDKNQLIYFDAPDLDGVEPIYLSYFIKWNSYQNYLYAKNNGFHDLTHEWDRTMNVDNHDQVDSRIYWIHPWMKYPKFGHTFATDYCSRMIRYGMMTREEALEKIKREKELDPIVVREFCEFLGYKEWEFWRIVDKFYNRDLFKWEGEEWILQD